jgi:alkyldihydroxyacetonephosphate synthase
MKWDAWGDPAAAKPLSDGIAGLLQQALGISGDNVPAVGLADVRLRRPPCPADRAGLAAIVDDANLRGR